MSPNIFAFHLFSLLANANAWRVILSLGIIITIDTVDMKAMTTIPVTGDTDQDTVTTITTTMYVLLFPHRPHIVSSHDL